MTRLYSCKKIKEIREIDTHLFAHAYLRVGDDEFATSDAMKCKDFLTLALSADKRCRKRTTLLLVLRSQNGEYLEK